MLLGGMFGGFVTTCVVTKACDGETKTFKDMKAKDMWKRLHSKQCELCRNRVGKTTHITSERKPSGQHLRPETIALLQAHLAPNIIAELNLKTPHIF
jgi:hypothetical protein